MNTTLGIASFEMRGTLIEDGCVELRSADSGHAGRGDVLGAPTLRARGRRDAAVRPLVARLAACATSRGNRG